LLKEQWEPFIGFESTTDSLPVKESGTLHTAPQRPSMGHFRTEELPPLEMLRNLPGSEWATVAAAMIRACFYT